MPLHFYEALFALTPHFYEGLFGLPLHFYEGLFSVKRHFYEGTSNFTPKNTASPTPPREGMERLI